MKKIAILIPAYKTEYLSQLFFVLRRQTYQNFHVLLSDDSPGGKVTELLRSADFESILSGLEMTVMQGPRKGSYKNVIHLLDVWNHSTDLFHLLLDDDIIYPRFYEYHVDVHHDPEVICSVSRRWTADASGLPVGALHVPPYVQKNQSRVVLLESQRLFKSVVPVCNNWLGEHSNMVLKKEAGKILRSPVMNGISYICLGDIGLVLNLSLMGKIAFIQDHMGFFRLNPGQHSSQGNHPVKKGSFLAWYALAAAALRLERISREEAFMAFQFIERALSKFYAQDETMKKFIAITAGQNELSDAMVEECIALWREFQNVHPNL